MILIKTISREYFRQNIGFYLLIILFAFGFLSGREHKQFAELLMASGLMLTYVVFVWLLHVVKSFLFFHRTIQLPEYRFLQDLNLSSKLHYWKELLFLQLSLNAPFAAYAVFLMVSGSKNDHWLGVFYVLIANVLLVLLPIAFMNFRLKNFNAKYSWDILPNQFSVWPNWSVLYCLRHLLNKQPVLFLSSKVYSMFFIIGGAKLFPTDEYDYRLLSLSVFFAAVGQFMLGKEFVSFSNEELIFERNFGLTWLKKFGEIALTSLTLILIEIVLILYHWEHFVTFFDLIQSIVFLFSMMILHMVMGMSPFLQRPENLNKLFYLGILLFILIMFKIPLTLFATVFLILSWFIFRRNYFTFEAKAIPS